MKQEQEVILELCQWMDLDAASLSRRLNDSLDYSWILGQLLMNRVGGVAYYSLEKSGILSSLNREFRNSLKTVYETNQIKTNSLQAALAEIAPVLSELDCRYALLKGAWLCGLYPVGLRTSNDLDILICSEDLTQLSALLKKAGFIQGTYQKDKGVVPADRRTLLSSRMNRGETVPFVKPVNLPMMEAIEIDVNFSLDFKPERMTASVGEMLMETQPSIHTPGGGLYTLSREDFLIHLCAHLYKEATTYHWVKTGRDLSLYKFCDIYLYCQQLLDYRAAEKLIRRIKKLRLERECYYTFLHTKILFPKTTTVLDFVAKNIKPADTAYLKQIVFPETGEMLQYDMDFRQWLFSNGRKDLLQKGQKVIYLQKEQMSVRKG